MRPLLLSLAITVFSLPVFAERLYVHLTAFDQDDRVTVEMTLPLTFVSKAADVLSRADLKGNCHIRVEDHDFDVEDMHRIAAALRAGDEGVLEVSRYEELRFRRLGDEVEIVAEDDWDRVVTRMPAELFFAAFHQDDRIDFAAALEILSRRGGGELLASTAEDGQVRVWIDRSKTIDGGVR